MATAERSEVTLRLTEEEAIVLSIVLCRSGGAGFWTKTGPGGACRRMFETLKAAGVTRLVPRDEMGADGEIMFRSSGALR